MPAMSALTDADLDKIRLIVKEEVKKEVMSLKADIDTLKTDIDTLKTDGTIRQTEITNLKENVNQGFDNVQKSFDRQNNVIIACIGIPLTFIAIGTTAWGILAHKRNTKDHALEKQIEVLTQEIETLKQQQTVNS